MQKKTLDTKAHLAAVEEPPHVRHFDGHIEIGVFHDNHRITAAEFESHSLDLTAGDLHDMAPDRCRASECDAANARISENFLAHRSARTGYYIDGAFWYLLLRLSFTKSCLLDQFDRSNRGKRSGAGRLDDNGVSGCERWAE